MPTAHLLCGKTGSGKTTFARQLEREGAVRFTLDEWMIHLYGHHMSREVFDDRVRRCMDLILDIAGRLARKDVSVALDCGFWSRESRRQARDQLRQQGAQTILHFFEVDDKELRRRLAQRNAERSEGAFEITPEMFETFSAWFEPPTREEGFVLSDGGQPQSVRREALTMAPDCPLCPSNLDDSKIREANQFCAFYQGGDPVLTGSGIIIPRAHRETVFDLSREELAATFDLLRQIRERIDRELQPDGYNLGWNCGSIAGQEVFHCHLHVIPRFANEPYAGRGIRYWLKQDANRRDRSA